MESGKIDATAVISSVRAVMRENLRSDLASVQMPVLLIYGENDPLIRLSSSPRGWLDDHKDNVRRIAFESSRHFPMLEEANKFNRLLREFLNVTGNLQTLELKEEWRRRVR
jgi:pimeloyl-ACP methyl ester carboxylesterase